jgi:hypothetical protein
LKLMQQFIKLFYATMHITDYHRSIHITHVFDSVLKSFIFNSHTNIRLLCIKSLAIHNIAKDISSFIVNDMECCVHLIGSANFL